MKPSHALALTLVCVASSACTPTPELAKVQEGSAFMLLDSLPEPLRADHWKVLKWSNLDAKRMSDKGNSCSGHAGVLERESDSKRFVVAGVVCGGTPLLTQTGNRLDARALPTVSDKDVTQLNARFVEAMAAGVNALWVSVVTKHDGSRPESDKLDELVVMRHDDQLVRLLELGHIGQATSAFEQDSGFPRTFLLSTGPKTAYRLRYSETQRRYMHDGYIEDDAAPGAHATPRTP